MMKAQQWKHRNQRWVWQVHPLKCMQQLRIPFVHRRRCLKQREMTKAHTQKDTPQFLIIQINPERHTLDPQITKVRLNQHLHSPSKRKFPHSKTQLDKPRIMLIHGCVERTYSCWLSSQASSNIFFAATSFPRIISTNEFLRFFSSYGQKAASSWRRTLESETSEYNQVRSLGNYGWRWNRSSLTWLNVLAVARFLLLLYPSWNLQGSSNETSRSMSEGANRLQTIDSSFSFTPHSEIDDTVTVTTRSIDRCWGELTNIRRRYSKIFISWLFSLEGSNRKWNLIWTTKHGQSESITTDIR